MEKTASRSAGKSRVKNGNLSPRAGSMKSSCARFYTSLPPDRRAAALYYRHHSGRRRSRPELAVPHHAGKRDQRHQRHSAAIQNTLYVIIVTLIIVLPLGVGAAIYLTEYAGNRRLVAAIEYATETLAGIPSILYALVGMLVFCQMMGLGKTLLAVR